MLLSQSAIERADGEGLRPDDFYRASHGAIFQVVSELHAKGEPVDAITVSDALQVRGLLEKAGGAERVYELAAIVPSASNAGHWAKIVRQQAGLRRLIRAGEEITRLGWERPGELDDLLGMAETALSHAVAPTFTTQFASIADGLDEMIAGIEEAIATGKIKFGLKTDFYDLDQRLTGFHPGQLILVAARPSMGKSALAQNIAENVVDRGGKAAFVALEMSKAEVQLRSLSRAAGLDSKILRTGRVRPEDVPKFRAGAAAVKMRDGSLFIEDDASITVQKLRAEARRLQRTVGLDLLVVDYLQLMLSSQTKENRQQEISTISRGLKLLARELSIPVLALSQLNRNLETRDNKRPVLSDLRDSGSLEQDADVVLFIYRDDYYNPDSMDVGIAEIIVSKNRQGEGGSVKLRFKKETTEFQNLASGMSPLRSAA
jgi:replicative DNA helicase